MRILVIGHSGFIGKHLTRCIKKRNLVCNTCTIPSNYATNHEFINAVAETDIIVHLAGKNRAKDIELYQTNVYLMLSLLDTVLGYNPQAHIIFASSFQVLYNNSLYGASKKACEDLLTLYAKRNKIRSTILRLSNVYGPGCKPFYNSVIATYVYQIINNQPINVNGDGNQKRDYIYIDDTVNAFLSVINQNNSDEYISTYNICSGIQSSLNDIITVISKATGKDIQITKIQKPEPEDLPNLLPESIRMRTGWYPKTSIVEGIKEILKRDYEYTNKNINS